MRRIALLVYGELPEVAHELLARRDLDLRWAMTLEEALAVSRTAKLDLVITTDSYALEYLRADPSCKPTCIAVVEPRASSEALAAGATVVAAHEQKQILSAISELTGLAFRMHPRAAIETIVDVTFQGRSIYLSTIDVSASGVALSDFPDATYGDRARVTFDMFDPPVSGEAIVVRMFQRDGLRCAGLCFTEMTIEDRARLRELVDQERSETTIDSVLRAHGNDTRDLLALLSREADRGLSEYMRLISERVTGCSTRTPSWLDDLADELTGTERRSLELGEQSWARAAVGMRIELRRQLIENETKVDTSAALDLCRLIAIETLAAPDDVASDAATIRAHVLRDASHLARAIR